MPVTNAPVVTKPTQKSETLLGSIARVSRFPTIGDNPKGSPTPTAWKGNWDNWKDWDQWQDSHHK